MKILEDKFFQIFNVSSTSNTSQSFVRSLFKCFVKKSDFAGPSLTYNK